jgi:hypothetical protein
MISGGVDSSKICSKLSGSQKAYCEELVSECASKAKSSGGKQFEVNTCYTAKPLKLKTERMCGLILPRFIGLKGSCPDDEAVSRVALKKHGGSSPNDGAAKSACGKFTGEQNDLCREMVAGCMDASDTAGGGKFEYKTCYDDKTLKLSKPRMCGLLMPRLVSVKGLCTGGAATVAKIPPVVEEKPVLAVKSPVVVERRADELADDGKLELIPLAPLASLTLAEDAADEEVEADDSGFVDLEVNMNAWVPVDVDYDSDIEFKRGVVELTRKKLMTEWKDPMTIVVTRNPDTDDFRTMVNEVIEIPKAKDPSTGKTKWGRIGIIDWSTASGRAFAHAIGVPGLMQGEMLSEWEVRGKFVGEKFVGKVRLSIGNDFIPLGDLMREHNETEDPNGFLYMDEKHFDRHFGAGQDTIIDEYIVVKGKSFYERHDAYLAESLSDEQYYHDDSERRYLWDPMKRMDPIYKKIGITQKGVWRVTRTKDGWQAVPHRSSGFRFISNTNDVKSILTLNKENVLVVVGSLLGSGRKETKKFMKALRKKHAAGTLVVDGKKVDGLAFIPRSNVENIFPDDPNKGGEIIDYMKSDDGLPQAYFYQGKRGTRKFQKVPVSTVASGIERYKPKAKAVAPASDGSFVPLKGRREVKITIPNGRNNLTPVDASDSISYNIFLGLEASPITVLYGSAKPAADGGYVDKELQVMADELGAALFSGRTEFPTQFIDTQKGDAGFLNLFKRVDGKKMPSERGLFTCERPNPRTVWSCHPYALPK